MTPDEQRAVRRHLHSAEGAHRFCRRKVCRRARACRLAETCASRLYANGLFPDNSELITLHYAFMLELFRHWDTLPRVPHAKRGPKAP